ncbi:hypothetical protein [uncultured Sphingomonas sp.]|uniref:hypothetical protein n=1 Tax=uncultured Sphingomonas sp. TaxID=158754 RepID=UPI003749CAC6
MSMQSIHLRKLLKIMYLDGPARVSALRADIRDDISRERDDREGSGGDFYGPFWRDAKDHVFGASDLREQTRLRIARNNRRRNLYEQLRDGFLLWWDERRRWTNEPFQRAGSIRTVKRLDGVDADIKFANVLAVRDGNDEEHFVYPYWFARPPLNNESARLGLWALCEAFPHINRGELRLLDVIRGQTYSLDRNPLRGDEAALFQRRFLLALNQWTQLRREYD